MVMLIDHEVLKKEVLTLFNNLDANVLIHISKNSDEGSLAELKFKVLKKMLKDNLGQVYESALLRPSEGTVVVKDLIRDLISKKILSVGDRMVCFMDQSAGTGFAGAIHVLDVDDVLFKVSNLKLPHNIDPKIFDAVVKIALEISHEGREGKKIGTAFLIGDKDVLFDHSSQLVLNPFLGYPPDQRRIYDPAIHETIKEFAQLDGAFLIGDDGTVLSAGSIIHASIETPDLPKGFGTRHKSCAALTALKDIVAVVVSQSGRISVIKGGKIIATLG